LASLLDPRSKTMHDWPIELQTKTIALLRIEYENFKEKEIIEQVENPSNQQTIVKSFSSKIFGPSQSYLSNNDEINFYLDNIRIPPALPDMDPFKWWYDNEKRFPVLFNIARKFLGIPATSVPSERLFSDAGNQITSERNRLKAETVSELLFLKRNTEYINPFMHKFSETI
jgi:hypothetical protein